MSKANRRLAHGCVVTLAVALTASAAQAQTDNTVTGVGALKFDTTGSYNTATGVNALHYDTTASYCTATGRGALFNNNASENTATGYSALYSNTTGTGNTAMGLQALGSQATANYNTSVGWNAMSSNLTGSYNTALGASALQFPTTGNYNVALGFGTLTNSTSGTGNTGVGGSAVLASNTTGSYNTAVGTNALSNSITGSHNSALGENALNRNGTGSSNTAVGSGSGPASGGLSNTASFGANALATASNTIQIGDNTITTIGGYQPWSNLSDARFKTEVTEDVPGLRFVSKLRPVTFRWDLNKLDAFDGVSHAASDPVAQAARAAKQERHYTGFLAQEVESAAQQCGYDFSGVIKPANERSHYELSYAEFVVPLVKAVQEQQQQIEALRAMVQELKTARQPPAHAGLFGEFSTGALAVLGALVLLRSKQQRSS